MKVHLFNPENDLALASFSPTFTPPKNAIAMARSGATLPFWFGDDGDAVIADNLDLTWLESLATAFDLKPTIFEPSRHSHHSPMPWGWSPMAAREFQLRGIDTSLIPSTNRLSLMREISHRRTSIDINRRLRQHGFATPDLPLEINSIELFLSSPLAQNDIIIKSPWSSSGRGVIDSTTMPPRQLLRHIEGIIRHQGSVMVEHRLNRIADFAMLFSSSGSGVKFEGYSLFQSNDNNQYIGNIVAPQSIIIDTLQAKGADTSHLDALKNALISIIGDIVGGAYEGPLGVDMMIYETIDGSIAIAPCIELNLRNTMGHVALALSRRYLAAGSTGTFTIEHNTHPTPGEMIADNGKLAKGIVELNQPGTPFALKFLAQTMQSNS